MFKIKEILSGLVVIVAIFFLAGCAASLITYDPLPHRVRKGYVQFHFDNVNNERYLKGVAFMIKGIVQGVEYKWVCDDSFRKIVRVAAVPGMNKYVLVNPDNEEIQAIEINIVEGMVTYVPIKIQTLRVSPGWVRQGETLSMGKTVHYTVSMYESGTDSIEEADKGLEEVLKN